MELSREVNRQIKVRIEELESKIRSKDDLDNVLRQCCKYITFNNFKGQYYLPHKNNCPIRFLRDVLSGKKKVIYTLTFLGI